MNNVVFGFLAVPKQLEADALILARSIRSFGGRFEHNPLLVLIPEPVVEVQPDIFEGLSKLGAQIISFPISERARHFPFAAKVYAAAAAEQAVSTDADILVWMDSSALVINEPGGLLLSPGKSLGYRPVDHRLIGSLYNEPLDPYWKLVYEECGTRSQDIFPMVTSVDMEVIRPYFNAGMLVVRPQRKLLAAWRNQFDRLYSQDVFKPYFEQNKLYGIFLHQALLSATILVTLEREELFELPHIVNYPLHMHTEYPPERRVARMNDLISLRYEAFFDQPDWQQKIQVDEPVKSWLVQQLAYREEVSL